MATLPARRSFTYRQVDGCEIRLDLFGEGSAQRPLVMWVHGGGLIFGNRLTPRPALVNALVEGGALVASIDHRLAPETKLADIVDDLHHAWAWCQGEAARAAGVDPARVAIAGSSAGGYLSLLGGARLRPAPRAVVSYFGFGDITTPWETEPSAHYRQYPLVTEAEARASVGTRPVAEAPAEPDRSTFYLWVRQQGLWPEEVAGHDPATEPRWFDAWCPARLVTPAFPPTLLIHGTDDKDVPIEESEGMAAAFAAAGVEHEWLPMPGIGHGFAGGTPELAAATDRRAAAFLLARLG